MEVGVVILEHLELLREITRLRSLLFTFEGTLHAHRRFFGNAKEDVPVYLAKDSIASVEKKISNVEKRLRRIEGVADKYGITESNIVYLLRRKEFCRPALVRDTLVDYITSLFLPYPSGSVDIEHNDSREEDRMNAVDEETSHEVECRNEKVEQKTSSSMGRMRNHLSAMENSLRQLWSVSPVRKRSQISIEWIPSEESQQSPTDTKPEEKKEDEKKEEKPPKDMTLGWYMWEALEKAAELSGQKSSFIM